MSINRNQIVKQAQSWLGLKEADGSHKKIINIYNGQKTLPRGYQVQYKDSWCATFVSAVAIVCEATDIIPTECSCQQMIKRFQSIKCWQERDNHFPQPGDIIFYDWQDSGKGDNQGWSDHVGIVEKVSNNKISVIEGNYSDSVKRRLLDVNGRYIRGYGVPNYGTEPVATQPTTAALKVGDKVRLKPGANTSRGDSLASFVYNRDHEVKQIKGDRVVISYKGTVIAAVDIKDLIRV